MLTYVPQTESKDIISSNLPRSFHNSKIVYVSDFLYRGSFDKSYIRNVVANINKCRADIIILGGNYGQDYEKSIEFFEDIPNLHANIAVCAVLGENDRPEKSAGYSALEKAMDSKNVKPLVNDIAEVKIGDDIIKIIGIDDYVTGSPDLISCLNKTNGNDFIILACNSTNGIKTLLDQDSLEVKNNVDISLFGSTLGGQYLTASWWQLLTDPLNVPKYYTGWHDENRMSLLVSNGIGTKVLPIRLLVRPQIHLITLKYN